MGVRDTRQVYQTLAPGDRVGITQVVRVGFRHWTTATVGTVVRTARERHSLHFRRNNDDRVYRDILVLRRDDEELTTVTLDECTQLKVLGKRGQDSFSGQTQL
jgi:hypothetical protein